jgi:SAM-dependent methyltransferase
MPGRVDYGETAASYDATRAASPSVLDALRRCLSGAPGARLLDVGGGTGNYAAALREDPGLDPVVVDLYEPMLARAAEKGLPTIAADAEELPFPSASFDAVTMISMLHQVVGWQTALDEAQRVLVPRGRLALMVFARENLGASHWIADYFPSTKRWLNEDHQPVDEIRAALPRCRLMPVRYEGVEDGSLAALCRDPELILDEAIRDNTSFFQRLRRDNPGELAIGLADLWRDLSGGRRPHEDPEVVRRRRIWGDAMVVCWTKPGGARSRGAG